MTEISWDDAFDPADMLEAIRGTANASRLWEYVKRCLYGIGADSAVDLLQSYIAGNIEEASLLAHRHALEVTAGQRSGGGFSQGHKPITITQVAQGARAALAALQPSPWSAADQVTRETRHELQRLQCDWLRCLFPDPNYPITLDPGWLTPTVLDLARTINEEQVRDRMPILADALIDSGCDNQDILQHCQGPGPHFRGCWVVDLVLGNG